jgi:hypothetical protein
VSVVEGKGRKKRGPGDVHFFRHPRGNHVYGELAGELQPRGASRRVLQELWEVERVFCEWEREWCEGSGILL